MTRVEKLLKLAADMEAFSDGEDALSRILRECTDDELELDDLDRIAAAASHPSYEQFLKNMEKRKK